MQEEEQIRPASPVNTAMKYGAYTGFAIVMAYVINMLVTHRFVPWLRMEAIAWIIFIVFMVLGVRHYRDKELGGYISFWKATGTGILVSLFSGMIIGIFWYLYLKFFLSDSQIETYKHQTLEMSQALVDWLVNSLKQQPSSDTDTFLKQSQEGTKLSRNSIALAMFQNSIIAKTPIGAFLSLIAAIFLKNDRPAIS